MVRPALVRGGLPRREFIRIGLAAAAAPLALGCGDGTTEPVADPRLSARPGSPSATPPIGVSELGLGDERDGLLYVPATYTAGTSWPLFVALHGAAGDAGNWASYYARAEARGMILLIPESRGPTWDLLLGDLGADVAFIDRALRFTFDRCRIDPARVAFGGFSDGASYALSLGVSNGDLFTHLVAYSPGFLWATDPVVGKPRVFISHGTADPVLPITTTRREIVPGLRNEGYDVTFREFEGGHLVPAEISESALDWFLA